MQPKPLENGIEAGPTAPRMTDALRGFRFLQKASLLPAVVGEHLTPGRDGFVRLVDAMPRLYPVGTTADQIIVDAARVSYGGIRESDTTGSEGLLRYLMRHKHTSPLEQVSFRFHVRAPIFIARQWLRHRTAKVNEISARYSEIPPAYYLPEDSDVRFQPAGKGQVSRPPEEHSEDESVRATSFTAYIGSALAEADQAYRAALRNEIAREQARLVQPVGAFTEFVWKIDLHNLLHFLALRADATKAQPEIAVYAQAIIDLIRPIVPISLQAWEDYHDARGALRLTALDVAVARSILLGGDDEGAAEAITNKRERKECLQKLEQLGILSVPGRRREITIKKEGDHDRLRQLARRTLSDGGG